MAHVVIKPEMSGKIIDESHFKFHVECKAKVVAALHKMKNGFDFMKALSKQNFTTDKEWVKNTCKDPNVKVLLEILEEYKKQEHRPSRAKILIPLIEYAIALYASDLFYRERGEWFMFQLIRRAPQMQFASVFIDPEQWYPKTRNIVKRPDGTVCVDYYKEENGPNAKTIEQEYMDWYGIDATKDIEDIDPEIRKKIIADNVEWMKKNGLEFRR